MSFSPLEQGQHNNYAQALGHYTDVGAYSWVRVIGIYPLAWLQPAVSSQCKCRRVTGTWRLLWMPCLALSAWLSTPACVLPGVWRLRPFKDHAWLPCQPVLDQAREPNVLLIFDAITMCRAATVSR